MTHTIAQIHADDLGLFDGGCYCACCANPPSDDMTIGQEAIDHAKTQGIAKSLVSWYVGGFIHGYRAAFARRQQYAR